MIYEQLLQILADDSREQLGLIQDATDGLLVEAADSPLKGKLERIHQSVWELNTLINDISNFYAHSAGHLGDAESDFDLRVTLDGVRVRFSRSRPQSDWIALTRVRHDVPTLLRGAPARLQDILLGVAAGVLNSGSPGSLRIEVAKGWERDGRIELIFNCTLHPQQPPTGDEVERFRRTLDPAPEGAPLPRRQLRTELARRLACASEGSLAAVTTGDAPLAFELRLPFSMRTMAANTPAESPLPALRGHRVLVVDSSAPRRERTEALTRLWGLQTDGVSSGQEALQSLRLAGADGRPYHLALIDAELEDMTGMMLGRLMRLEPSVERARLALQFRVGIRGDGAKAEAVGFDAYLPRILPVPELREAMAILLQRRTSDRRQGSLLTRHSLADLQLEGVRILLVGNDPLGALVLEELLGRKGFRVERVADLDQAVRRCEHHRYPLIILDLGPIAAGDLSLASGFKALVDERGPTPVAVLFESSGRGEQQDLAGFIPDAAFAKPVDLERICEYCEGLLFPHLATERTSPAADRTGRAAGTREATLENETAFEPIWLEAATMGIGSLKRSVVDSYLNEMPGRIEEIAAAIHAGDFVTAEREVLGARAMAQMIGAVSTARCLVVLAEQVQERRMPEAHATLAHFRTEAERGLVSLRAARATLAEPLDPAA